MLYLALPLLRIPGVVGITHIFYVVKTAQPQIFRQGVGVNDE